MSSSHFYCFRNPFAHEKGVGVEVIAIYPYADGDYTIDIDFIDERVHEIEIREAILARLWGWE